MQAGEENVQVQDRHVEVRHVKTLCFFFSLVGSTVDSSSIPCPCVSRNHFTKAIKGSPSLASSLENTCTFSTRSLIVNLKWISSLDTQTPIHSGHRLRTRRLLLPRPMPAAPPLANPVTTWLPAIPRGGRALQEKLSSASTLSASTLKSTLILGYQRRLLKVDANG
jgi:hypothetical protein